MILEISFLIAHVVLFHISLLFYTSLGFGKLLSCRFVETSSFLFCYVLSNIMIYYDLDCRAGKGGGNGVMVTPL